MANVETLGAPSTTPTSPEILRISVTDYDFVTMHNILYFLYTGHVNLHFGEVPEQKLPRYPEEADAFNLFCAADFYCLQPLKDRCFRFLIDTRTPDNICTRLFNKRCRLYKDLQEKYITFILEYYYEVTGKDSWRSLFDWGEESIEEQKFRGEVLFEISQRVSSPEQVW
jgi:BTB/POZ domain